MPMDDRDDVEPSSDHPEDRRGQTTRTLWRDPIRGNDEFASEYEELDEEEINELQSALKTQIARERGSQS